MVQLGLPSKDCFWGFRVEPGSVQLLGAPNTWTNVTTWSVGIVVRLNMRWFTSLTDLGYCIDPGWIPTRGRRVLIDMSDCFDREEKTFRSVKCGKKSTFRLVLDRRSCFWAVYVVEHKNLEKYVCSACILSLECTVVLLRSLRRSPEGLGSNSFLTVGVLLHKQPKFSFNNLPEYLSMKKKAA